MGGKELGPKDGILVGKDEVRLDDDDDIFGVTVGVGLDGGEGLSSNVIVRLKLELETPVLPLTASVTETVAFQHIHLCCGELL